MSFIYYIKEEFGFVNLCIVLNLTFINMAIDKYQIFRGVGVVCEGAPPLWKHIFAPTPHIFGFFFFIEKAEF